MEWVCPIDAPSMMTVPTVSLRQGESEGLAKQFWVVIEMDEPVGQSQGRGRACTSCVRTAWNGRFSLNPRRARRVRPLPGTIRRPIR